MINPRASFNVLSWKTGFEQRNRGSVFVVLAIVASLHVLALLLALREGLHAKATATRPKAVPLIVRMIPPEMRPIPAASVEEKTSPANVRSTQHVQKMRLRKKATEAATPIAKDPATGATVAHQSSAANTEPTPDANAQPNQTSAANMDWQGDLKRLDPSRTRRYRPASPFNPSHADTGSPAPASPLSRGVSEATRRDCRNAHARHGLLALPMLMYGAASESGCKW